MMKLELNIQLFAHKKGQGSSTNGRDSAGRRLGSKVTFDEVLMLGETIGNPTVKGAKVTGEIVKHGKGKKIKIFTYKPNTTSTRKKQGHRQPYTEVKINKIG